MEGRNLAGSQELAGGRKVEEGVLLCRKDQSEEGASCCEAHPRLPTATLCKQIILSTPERSSENEIKMQQEK